MNPFLKDISEVPGSPLRGKRLLFLGSSVTRGYAAQGISMADILQAADRCIVRKEAVDGTTLADVNERSYLHRLMQLDPAELYDCVICQFSTNDAAQNLPLGAVSDAQDPEAFDTRTILGSLEAVISYVTRTWACPFVLYTSPRYSGEAYEKMMLQLPQLQQKWAIPVIDLWNDVQFDQISQDREYMADPIHPTLAGYLHRFTPAFRKVLYPLFDSQK